MKRLVVKRSFDFLSRQHLIIWIHLAIRKTSSLLVSTPSTFKFVGDVTVFRKGLKGLQDHRIPQYFGLMCFSLITFEPARCILWEPGVSFVSFIIEQVLV